MLMRKLYLSSLTTSNPSYPVPQSEISHVVLDTTINNPGIFVEIYVSMEVK